jgi:V8-like Glu-specific endopeptidase
MKKCLSTHDVETTTDIQNLFQSIGVIKSSWYSPTSQLEAISYGSACLIANNIVLTCAHNVFNENRGQFCTEAVFFPNVGREALSLSKGYPSQKGKFYQCLPPI